MIPYGRQTIEEDDIEEVVKVLKSDFLTTGPKVAEFERAVAEYVGAKYAVAISNDTAALPKNAKPSISSIYGTRLNISKCAWISTRYPTRIISAW